MSSNKSSGLGNRLIEQSPLSEEISTGNNVSYDRTNFTHGIMNNGASNIRPTLETNYRVSSSNPTVSKTMGNICSRCEKTVYFAEEVKAAGQTFHKQCYKCVNCKKSINGANYSEHDGYLYDNNCYKRLFGPKGVGYGIGAGTLSTGT
ncbi:unnamed protein product [Rotaria sordida]|uniref:LIM zinc-binding domain-containing protein n=2 Tax=Rotaria sordida TaxID=392033 RepID=A0A814T319_9BILA|nr:unnamed protein product [Rotaria sordida]CAF1403932.1 unnamed protein product [Rotaria sordida]